MERLRVPACSTGFLIHDRDADFGGDFDERLATLGIAGVRKPPAVVKLQAGVEVPEVTKWRCGFTANVGLVSRLSDESRHGRAHVMLLP